MRPEKQDLSYSRNRCHTYGIYSHGGMMENSRIPFSELHLAKFLHFMEFQSWKVTLKTEVSAKNIESSNHDVMDHGS